MYDIGSMVCTYDIEYMDHDRTINNHDRSELESPCVLAECRLHRPFPDGKIM